MSCDVGVVGGGIFGVSAAVALAESGHKVTLFEAGRDLLCAASGINQYRLHRGYHYPRSSDTAITSRDAEAGFRAAYPGTVCDGDEHYYAVARRDSLTDGETFVRFLEEQELEYRVVKPPFVEAASVDLCVAVREGLIDVEALRASVWRKLRAAGVTVRIRHRAARPDLEDRDFVVLASYAALNELLEELGETATSYRFKVVEKPVVRPPSHLRDRSLVVLDGPFFCLDPFGRTGLSVLGHVVHSVHATNVGRRADVPAGLAPLLDNGVIEAPPGTRFPLFVEAAASFVPDLRRLEHVGSMFTIRTVLPGLEASDARPTVVRQHGPRLLSLFSGKIGTCVSAAAEVVDIVEGRFASAVRVARGGGIG